MKTMNIALVAHDGRKQEMLEWVKYNFETLLKHNLYATGTTGKLILGINIDIDSGDKKIVGIGDDEYEVSNAGNIIRTYPFNEKKNVTCLLSGPLGGDQQIGAMIAEGKVDCLIFFCDNLITQGHQQDVSALTRLASLYNVPFATNRTTADMILTSPLFGNEEYTRVIPGAIEKYKNRQL